MFKQYDLVQVTSPDDENYLGAIGIITEVDQDIDGDICYRLFFKGEKHNRLARRTGIPYFYKEELEGI